MCGRPCRPRGFRITPPEAGVGQKPTNCLRGKGKSGERLERSTCHLSRVTFRRQWGGQLRRRIKTMTTQTTTAVMPKTDREVRILADASAIAQTAAAEFVEAAKEAVCLKDSFSVALAGGSTPKALYGLLLNNGPLRAMVPWNKIQFFFGDERHVPPDNADSNFRMASEAMLAKAPVDATQVHRIKGEIKNAAVAAEEYESDLRTSFRLQEGQLPLFDL